MSGVAKVRSAIPVSGPARIRVTNRSGDVVVTGETRADVEVVGAAAATEADGTIAVNGKSGKIKIRVPEGSHVIVGTGSGDVELRGALGDARATTGSGSIEVDRVASLDARSGSGSLEVDDCAGRCSLQTGSGTVKVGRAGDAELVSGSGTVVARNVSGARVKAGSGSVEVGLTEAGDVDVQAHSGSVRVTVPAGCCPTTDLTTGSGTVRCDCDTGSDGRVRVVAGSGQIVVSEA